MSPMPNRLLFAALALSLLIFPSCRSEGAGKEPSNPTPPAETGRDFKVVHLYVALCDNASQGIAPVPEKIGNGDVPAENLYWGCTEGVKSCFSHSKLWKRIGTGKVAGQPAILERVVFRHRKTRALLVADAWRGSAIKPCTEEFIRSAAGQHYESYSFSDDKGPHKINLAGGADFLAFIGHNGLMDFRASALPANPRRRQKVDLAILCCKSNAYFAQIVAEAKVRPVLATASNMYPGAFILRDVLEGWLAGENRSQLRTRAAKAYAKNQGISLKSALTVFAKLP
jgi:hypothetical protein